MLEVHADPALQEALKAALLAAPWEILARDGMHLAADRIRLFTVARRCSPPSEPVPPIYSDLSLLFMAAAPEGQSDLDYEAEEVAILEATAPRTGGAPLAHVTVEESGARLLLGERCRRDGPFEVVHLSCHGDILKPDGSRAMQGDTGAIPQLLLEDEEGCADLVPPERLVAARGTRRCDAALALPLGLSDRRRQCCRQEHGAARTRPPGDGPRRGLGALRGGDAAGSRRRNREGGAGRAFCAAAGATGRQRAGLGRLGL